MNPVLLGLIWTETRAILRLALGRLPTTTGLLIAAAGLVLMAGVPYAAYLSVAHQGNFTHSIAFLRRWAPEAFFVFVMLGAVAPRGLYYRPAELALLFPAPIPRRQLVLYNILWRARMAVLSGLWLAFLGVLSGVPPLVAFLGYTLMLLLLQTSSQFFAVLRSWLGERPRAAFAVKLGAAAILAAASASGRLIEAVSALAWTTRPALEILSAEGLRHALPWAAAAAATILALVTATCMMDGAYHESALTRSWQRRRRKCTRGGAGAYGPGVRTAWLRVPPFPRLGGVGPMAWRQSIEIARNPRRIVLVLAVVAASALGAVVLVQLEAGTDFSIMTPSMRAWVVVFVLAIAPLLSGDSLGFDFRRDLDRMATLKSFPLSPTALSVGQIAPATLFVSSVQLLGVSTVAMFTESISAVSVVTTLALLIPMNWCAIASENTLFLVAPYRTVVDDPGDMTFAGRLALATTLKMASLAILGLCSVLVSLIALRLSHGSTTVTVAALAIVLSLVCVPVTRVTGWAFSRFDVGRDVPA